MKLDVNVLRYLSKEDFRVLTAVEMGQKNVSRRQDNRVLLLCLL
jgi:RIO-like serine/threonine protein kinase